MTTVPKTANMRATKALLTYRMRWPIPAPSV